jgi:hypothetical protein
MLNDIIALPNIAYFSMENAFDSQIPTYSGGLGVLAADTLRSAAAVRCNSLVGAQCTAQKHIGYERDHPGKRRSLCWGGLPALCLTRSRMMAISCHAASLRISRSSLITVPPMCFA